MWTPATNMIKNFFFCESGIPTISKFYGSSFVQNLSCFSCPVPYKAYLLAVNQLFKTSYNTVVCELENRMIQRLKLLHKDNK